MLIMPEKTHTLIISDLHLGSHASSSKQVLNLLKHVDRERLIILGDLFDHAKIKKLKPADWELLSYFENRKKTGDEILWLKGNHDREFPHQLPHLANIPISEEYSWDQSGKKYIAIHGDRFDDYIQKGSFIVKMGDLANVILTALRLKNKLVMNTIGKLYGKMIKLSDVVIDGALKYAKEKEVDFIICGHTHFAVVKAVAHADKEITYLNSGAWTQTPLTYITVDDSGPNLHIYRE